MAGGGLRRTAPEVAQANLTDKTVFERFGLDKFADCFNEYADLLDWYKRWDVTLDNSNPPFWRWFVGGRINASHNCVDRHLAKHKNKTAIHFVPEPEHEAGLTAHPAIPCPRQTRVVSPVPPGKYWAGLRLAEP